MIYTTEVCNLSLMGQLLDLVSMLLAVQNVHYDSGGVSRVSGIISKKPCNDHIDKKL
jgi:hypothetical protein